MSEASADDRNIAVLIHLGGIFFSIVPGLVVWLLKKDDNPYIAAQAREALNFQITLLIAYMVSYGLMVVLIGFVLLGAVWLANIILCVVAAAKTSQGVDYHYPLTLRLIN
jgi:uncharacterized Tic20 family protein